MSRALALVLTLLVVAPRATQAASSDRPPRLATPLISRCGEHVVGVERGGVHLDDKPVHSSAAEVEILVRPEWRSDCGAVAWVELHGAEHRLIVVPAVEDGTDSLSWALPPTTGNDRIFWLGHSRVAVGVAILQPRALASWS